MSKAYDLLALGDVDGAIDAASAIVRERPLDLGTRLLLLDLACVNARWDRANRQLDAIRSLGGMPEAGLASYSVLIAAEQARASFAVTGEPAPSWIVEPPGWAADHLAGLDALRRGDPDAARVLLKRSEAAQPVLSGRRDGVAFEGFRDLDDTLGPFLEVVTQQGLCLAAWEDVRYLDVAPPAVVRDVLWAPARLALKQGPIGKVYLPALYAGTAAEPEGPVRLGRETRWRELGAGLVAGVGLKMFLHGEDSLTLFELREMSFGPDAPGG